MQVDLNDLLAKAVLAAAGWFCSLVWKNRRDLDAAFAKIRVIEERIALHDAKDE